MYINYKRKVECRKRDWEKHYPICTIQCSHYIKPQTIKKNRLNFNHEMQYSLYALVQVVEKGNFFFLVFSFSFQPAISAPLQTIPSTIQGTKFFSISSISWMVVLTAHCNLCLCPFSFEYNTIDTHSSQICFHYSLFFFLNTVHTMLFQWAPQNMGFSVLLRSALAIQMALTTRNNTHLH